VRSADDFALLFLRGGGGSPNTCLDSTSFDPPHHLCSNSVGPERDVVERGADSLHERWLRSLLGRSWRIAGHSDEGGG